MQFPHVLEAPVEQSLLKFPAKVRQRQSELGRKIIALRKRIDVPKVLDVVTISCFSLPLDEVQKVANEEWGPAVVVSERGE